MHTAELNKQQTNRTAANVITRQGPNKLLPENALQDKALGKENRFVTEGQALALFNDKKL